MNLGKGHADWDEVYELRTQLATAQAEIAELHKKLEAGWIEVCDGLDPEVAQLCVSQMAEIVELKERLNEVAGDWQVKHYQLASHEATIKVLRTALTYASECLDANDNYAYGITEALAPPAPNEHLRAFGMRVASAMRKHDVATKCSWQRSDFQEAIVDEIIGGGE